MLTIKDRQLLHPRGFMVLFLTEMWERYGFYVIQTLLVFYLIKKLNLSDSKSYVIVGSFTALAYINSVFGGIIADKLIGSIKTVIIGAIILCLGYTILGIATDMYLLTMGLGLISVGTGLLKPNVSSLVGRLYDNQDTRKDAGYTLYYVGIYIGALGGSLLGGYINKYFGFSGAFLSSAFGVLFGLIIFIYGIRGVLYKDEYIRKEVRLSNYVWAVFSIVCVYGISCLVLHSEFLATIYFVLMAMFCLGFILYIILSHNGALRRRMIGFLLLILMAVCYWAIYFQQFFSISLCTSRVTNSMIPASSIPAVESLAVIVFGLLSNYILYSLKTRIFNISIVTKFSLSFVFNMISFLLLSSMLWFAAHMHSYLNISVIIIAYIIIAIGELYISPTSLAMVSSLVPKRFESAMMGISLLSIGFGGKLAGLLALSASIHQNSASIISEEIIYAHSFALYCIFSVIAFIISLILGRVINKLIVR